MFDARHIHTTVWDVIQGRHQRGESMDLNIREPGNIAVGVPFFVPNPMRAQSCLGEQMNVKNWVDRYLMNEPILIDFDEHGIMVIRNENKGIAWFSCFDDLDLDANLWVDKKTDPRHYAVALFNVHFGVTDRQNTAQDIYAKTAQVVKTSMEVASAANASIEAMKAKYAPPRKPANPFGF